MHGVVDNLSIIIESTAEFLEVIELIRSLFFVGYGWNEKLAFLILKMSIKGMGGMLRINWKRMVEACKSFVDILLHRNINGLIVIIQFKINSTEDFTIPVDSDIVVIFHCISYMTGTVLSHNFGTKVIDDKFEGFCLYAVTKKSWCVACRGKEVIIKMIYYFDVRKRAELRETIDERSAFNLDISMLDWRSEIIFIQDVFGDDPLINTDIFVVTSSVEGAII